MDIINYTEEHRMFRDTFRKFVANELLPHIEEWEEAGIVPKSAWKKMGEHGFLGMSVPEEYGGAGADFLYSVIVTEELAHSNFSGLAAPLHTDIIVPYIMSFGSEEQKQKYLPGLATGDDIGCMCLTEPSCGSDAGALLTAAVRKGDKYILNGSKTFITNAPVAGVFIVFATLDRSTKHKGITCFIVDRDTPGLSTGNPMHKMGVKCSTTSEVFFEDCEVPAENLLGGEGNGWNIALGGVEWDRSTLLSPFLGNAMFTLESCSRYANERRAFGQPIGEFQSIQNRIADMRVYVEAARLAIYRVAASKDNGARLNPLLASVNKMYVGDKGFEMCSAAVDLFGGYGYIHEYPVERGMRDAKLGQLGGGTSDIMRMIVARAMVGRQK